MSNRNFITKILSLLFVMVLIVSMMPMNVFATEIEDSSSCGVGVHNFAIEKHDEEYHWHECSVCGAVEEKLNHYYDENGDTTCNGCSYERSIIEEFSIDKTLMSDGETATITIKVIDGYIAKWIHFNKPITNNIKTVYLYHDSNNTYTGTFSVDDQTESGVWKVRDLTLMDAEDKFAYLYNSNTYTGTYYDKFDFSSLNFEVIGTNADVVAPIIESYFVDKNVVSSGEKVTVTIQITDDHLSSSFSFWYKNPNGETEYITMKKVDTTGLYQGTFSIDEDCEIGVWRPYYFTVSDTNGNSTSLHNSKVTSYGDRKADLSSLNFEVVEINQDAENEEAKSFIVIFNDGYGNTLSTQKVTKGESAVEPKTPTNALYLFNGWDADFTNVNSNMTVTATWILNPDVIYDRESHVGKVFNIEVYSTVSQTYTITCSDDIEFSSSLVSSSMIFTDQLYYAKEYKIKVNEPGSYLFYVKGSRSSNTLTYKVKITAHDFNSEWIIDKEATCTEDGSKYRKCTYCDTTTDVTAIEKLGHDYSDEWTIDKEATCTEEGYQSRHCSRCDATTDKMTIDALSTTGHQYSKGWTIDKEATCTEAGRKSHHCLICGDKSEITDIPVLAHTYGDWIVVKAATCTKEGSQCKVCSCGYQITETIAAKGHETTRRIIREANCEEYGEIVNKCANCDYTLYESTAPLGHIERKEPKILKKATFNEYGSVMYICKRCGGSLRSDAISYINSVKLSISTFTYDGRTKTPTVIVRDYDGYKLVADKDYSVSYSSSTRKAIGRYSVKVVFKGNYSGSKTLYFTILPGVTSKIATATNSSAVKIAWKAVPGATGYRVYQYDAKTKKYVMLKTITGTSYTVSKLKSGTSYKFAVRAYTIVNGKVYWASGYKTITATTNPGTPTLKVTAGSKKATLSWNKQTGATGYVVYMATSQNGKYSKIATLKGNSSVTYTKTGLTKGKTYYFKVAAYTVANGKTLYSGYSSVKAVKIK